MGLHHRLHQPVKKLIIALMITVFLILIVLVFSLFCFYSKSYRIMVPVSVINLQDRSRGSGGYALVICNHAPHPRGIAGTLTFVLQIPAKSPALRGHPVGKTTALFPPQSVMFLLHCHVCLYKTNPWHLPRTAGTIKK